MICPAPFEVGASKVFCRRHYNCELDLLESCSLMQFRIETRRVEGIDIVSKCLTHISGMWRCVRSC